MIFLPIVVRELRVAARRKSVYRARFWTAFTTIAVGGYLVGVSSMMGRAGGATAFTTLAAMCFLSCLSLSRNTADCISEEKREGTLGFLFLTDLKGHDIALGKLVSNSLISFYSIIGIFPIVAVSLLLGGVSAIEFWEAALALLNVFFFSQSAGLLASAFSSKRNAGASGTAAILLGCTAGFYFLSLGLRAEGLGAWASLFEWLNPGYCVYWACVMGANPTGAFARQFGHYGISLLLVHLNGWLFLAIASWWLPRCWQEKSAKTRVRRMERFRLWYHARHTPRALLLDTNPFLWLTIRNRLGSIKIWSALLINSSIWGWFLARGKFSDGGVPLLITAIILNHLVLKVLTASEVSNNLEEQRHSGGLELLLSCTPLTVDEVVKGQWLALRRQFLWPVAAVLITDVAMLAVVAFRHAPDFDSPDEKLGFVLFVLAVMVMLIVDLFALGWMGMWNAMSKRKPRHASGATISQILILPWIILFFITTLLALLRVHHYSFGAALMFWFIVGIAVDIVAIKLFRPQLLAQFRALAAVQRGEALGLFGRLGRWLGRQRRPAL